MSRCVDHKQKKWWIIKVKKSDSSLNLNLIITFKDNRAGGHSQLLREIEDFAAEMDYRVSEIKDELGPLFGTDFPMTIAPRTLKSAKTYYWRFRAKNAQRKYARLVDPIFGSSIAKLHPDQSITLRGIENELLAINANLIVILSLKTALNDLSEARTRLSQSILVP